MYERLVEDWLTSSNELGYQIPFCEVLVTEGLELLHVSRHGRGEHGKDIVARAATGELCTFQLKGGDISLSEWRSIRGEIEELVQLPVRLPGISEDEAHTPVLVTNGELRGDAVESITRFADDWHRRGYPRLEVWQKGTLLRKFLNAQGSFLPSGLADFRRFVELYVADFTDELPTDRFAAFLELLVDSIDPEESHVRKRRALASVALVAAYIAGQYEREKNFVAATKAWTVAAANLLYVATRDSLPEDVYTPSLGLVTIAFRRCLETFGKEALDAENYIVGRLGLADPFVYGLRVTIVLAWLSVWSLDGLHHSSALSSPARVLKAMKREYKR
ncbi:MAG: hypothetical protein ACRD1T_09175, partial [Acidimicrobiia bacterium]